MNFPAVGPISHGYICVAAYTTCPKLALVNQYKTDLVHPIVATAFKVKLSILPSNTPRRTPVK